MQKTLSFAKEDYTADTRETLYQGVFRLSRYHVRHRLFNGDWSGEFSREILERPHAAALLPYDPYLDQVILIEQFRAGAIDGVHHPWLIEIVAGMIAIDEKPEDVAKRESLEEADCKVLDLCRICEYFVSPGGSNEYVHIYCGRVDAEKSGGFYGLAEENEDIRAFTMAANDAFLLLKQGKIKTSPAIISLQWLQLNREWLKKLWQTT